MYLIKVIHSSGKNGDNGPEYFSIVYKDNSGKQRLFYPDYLIGINDDIWIIETKGGESKSGQSEDIDKFSKMKFDSLKKYLMLYNLKGGFVRLNRSDMEVYINTEEYHDEMTNKYWKRIDMVF